MNPDSFIVLALDVPEEEGHYPVPFDKERLRFFRDIGRAAGSKSIGVGLDRLPPGERTSFTHAHSHEEELVYVLEGEVHVRLIEPGKEPREVLVAGVAAGGASSWGRSASMAATKGSGSASPGVLKTRLFKAAKSGDVKAARDALDGGVEVNALRANKWTALHEACRYGQLEVVKLLLAAGADPNIPHSQNGFTPMVVAAQRPPSERASRSQPRRTQSRRSWTSPDSA
jgi:hypothetical protein